MKKGKPDTARRILHDYFKLIGSKGGTAARGHHTLTREAAQKAVNVRIERYGQRRIKTAPPPSDTELESRAKHDLRAVPDVEPQ